MEYFACSVRREQGSGPGGGGTLMHNSDCRILKLDSLNTNQSLVGGLRASNSGIGGKGRVDTVTVIIGAGSPEVGTSDPAEEIEVLLLLRGSLDQIRNFSEYQLLGQSIRYQTVPYGRNYHGSSVIFG